METTNSQTPYTIARMLMDSLPGLGRLIAVRMRESGEEESTFMQIGVLMRLKEHPITASELAKLRKVSLQSSSVLVQNLVERGWLTRIPDPNDRRQSLLQITESGLAHAEAAHEQLLNMVAEILNDLQPDEIDAGLLFLPALRRAVSTQMTEPVPEK